MRPRGRPSSVDWAYELAYFVLRRQDLALRVAEQALSQLEVAMACQDRRLYYEPSACRSSSRTRALLSEAQQLQRLVYIGCEPYERTKEAGEAGGATPRDWIVHFVKHLVRITIRRNAFHALLGVGRLLFAYSTSETMEVQNLLVDEPEDVKDESYYRARKKVLMEELVDRFGPRLTVVRRHRGEERFLSLDDSRPYVPFVMECLARFTPWDTACWPREDGAALPRSAGEGDAGRELGRLHAVLHPECLGRLAAALRLEGPETRLAVPRLRPADPEEEEDHMSDDRSQPPPLLPSQRRDVEASCARRSRARKRARVGGALRIVVDGREAGCLDPVETAELTLTVAENAELLEVLAGEPGREVLLATLLLDAVREGGTRSASVVLEAGQRVTASALAHGGGPRAEGPLRVAISYREGRWRRALSLSAQRGLRRLGQSAERRAWRLGLGGSAVVLAIVAVSASVARRPTPPGAPSGGAPRTPGSGELRRDLPPPASDGSGSPGGSGGIHLRSFRSPLPRMDLAHVRRIRLEVGGEEALRRVVEARLTEGLRGGPFIVVTGSEGADAVLKVRVSAEAGSVQDATPPGGAGRRARVVARLVNARGDILWPAGLERGGHREDGRLDSSVDHIARELLDHAARGGRPGR